MLGNAGKRMISTLIASILVAVCLFASEIRQSDSVEHEKFNPGEFIFDHIGDSYYWHIIEIGHINVSIPLPVILYSKQQGLVAFMSSKLEHGHTVYRNFSLINEGENKGKIIEILPDGTETIPFDISITKNVTALLFSVLLLLGLF